MLRSLCVYDKEISFLSDMVTSQRALVALKIGIAVIEEKSVLNTNPYSTEIASV